MKLTNFVGVSTEPCSFKQETSAFLTCSAVAFGPIFANCFTAQEYTASGSLTMQVSLRIWREAALGAARVVRKKREMRER